MQYTTSRFGVIEVAEDQAIQFKGGLFGFTNLTRYTMIPHRDHSPFIWLQSLEQADLAFPLIDPHLIYPDYLLEVSRDQADELGIEDEEAVKIFVVVAMEKKASRMHLNMQGPIIINQLNRFAKQIVDEQCSYAGEVELAPRSEQQANGH
ncbi:MAG: flagellar assembly protein FliW [Deltaproteobacteria bacterium]|nr:flagellar assembly protein FliW [Candidatus Anaeroferrophillus wilburensis]MBN2889612.1 flagellar assembly protein FliW [Deltaproteobacteria bacterium]